VASLTTTNLSIGYKNKEIASNLNLELKQGQLVCLLGQNGVGKSTLLRTLASLQLSLGGQIEIDGQSIDAIDKKELAKTLGIITTEKIGTSNMSIRELVALGRFPYTDWLGKETLEDTAKIEEAISTCKINYIEKSKLGSISDGQFQKAMVARVLAQDTDIILMDEPTAHLDVVNRIEMFQILSQIARDNGRSILVSTHELDLAMQFADELWLMDFEQPMVTGYPCELQSNGSINKIFHHDRFDIDLSHGGLRVVPKSD